MGNIVVGTSGHIDHGKSTLVKALTGTDPDRWIEEKKRGITIDLGFAHYQQEDLEVSFVDVPGHERFIHNMLAGISGIDLLLLVIAADDGVMPQTREHLHICNLLGVQHGIIVLSRQDLVDEEMLEMVEAEVEELVEETFLQGAKIIKTSAVTGEGLQELKSEIYDFAHKLPPKDQNEGFRLPIDRSFSIKGFGTVVTGTVVSGEFSLEQDNMAQLHPGGQEVRIRGIQAHGKEMLKIGQGQRAAINLAKLSKEEVGRGNQISLPGNLIDSLVVDAELQIIPGKERFFKNRMKLKFYSGTHEISAKVIYHSSFEDKDETLRFVQIRFENLLSCRYGDRFILRNFSPQDTLAGGTIIAPIGNRTRKNRTRLYESLEGLSSTEEATRILESIFIAGIEGIQQNQLSPRTGVKKKKTTKELQKLLSQGKIVQIHPDTKRFLHQFHCQRISSFLVRSLRAYHGQFPERAGLSTAELTGKLSRSFTLVELEQILEWMTKQKSIIKENHLYRLPEFTGHLTQKQDAMKEKILQALQKNLLQPPTLSHLCEEVGGDPKEIEKILKLGIGEKWSIRVKADLWFHFDALGTIQGQLIEFLKKNETITVIQFKDLMGISRKYAISLLEYFDGLHLTARIENHRILRLKN